MIKNIIHDLIRFLFKVDERLYETVKKKNIRRIHFQSTNNIIVYLNAIKSALTSAKNEVMRNFDRYNARVKLNVNIEKIL